MPLSLTSRQSEKLQQSTEYSIVFRDCCEVLPTKESFEECPLRDIPLAIHVPINPEEKIPEGAFAAVPRLRHVSVASGMKVVGAEAWQSCRQLRIVKLPVTVISIADNVFRGCQLLNHVTAPGCEEFGYKAFAECRSLQWVCYGVANNFAVPLNLVTAFFEIAKPSRLCPEGGCSST